MKRSIGLLAFLALSHPSAQASVSFECMVSYKGNRILMVAPNEQETYMNEAIVDGLFIRAFHNSGGDSYSVGVRKGKKFLVSATLPFYEDANLTLDHKGEILSVICRK